MKIIEKTTLPCFLLLVILIVCGSYFCNFAKSEKEMSDKINDKFKEESPLWGDAISSINKIPYWGKYDSRKYANKKRTTLLSAEDTIVISSSFYHPAYTEYQRRNRETNLLLDNDFDIVVADSLFEAIITKLGIIAESSVELKIRDLHQMFPTPDSMYMGAPFIKTLSSGSVEGFTTDTVGVGICDHALFCGHVKFPLTTVLANMNWFGTPQIYAIVLLITLLVLKHYIQRLTPIGLQYKRNAILMGNTCLDLANKELYLWNGECRHITGTKSALIQMLVEASPTYKLLKEDVCRTIWNRNAKDGQALYNTAMTDLRGLFISEDPSLELKSLPKEGMQLVINESQVRKKRSTHFLMIYLYAHLRKKAV